METAGAIGSAMLAFALSWYATLLWARRLGSSILTGLAVGLLSLGIYLALAGWVESRWPAILDVQVVGRQLIVLVLALPLAGILGAFLAYRWHIGRWRY